MNTNELLDLYQKPNSYQFTMEDLIAIRKANPRTEYEIRYCIYNKNSNRDMYITFIIDSKCTHPRKSGVENQWEEICRRPIAKKEYEEFMVNFGTNNRRFKVWTYKYIDNLIEDDKLYGIETPQKFINVCVERGYKEKEKQLKLKL